MFILFLFLVGVHALDSKVDYDACKKEEFKPSVCERYKSLIPPSEQK